MLVISYDKSICMLMIIQYVKKRSFPIILWRSTVSKKLPKYLKTSTLYVNYTKYTHSAYTIRCPRSRLHNIILTIILFIFLSVQIVINVVFKICTVTKNNNLKNIIIISFIIENWTTTAWKQVIPWKIEISRVEIKLHSIWPQRILICFRWRCWCFAFSPSYQERKH